MRVLHTRQSPWLWLLKKSVISVHIRETRCYQSIYWVYLTSQLTFRKNQVYDFVNGEGDDAPRRKAEIDLHGC